MEHAKQLFDAGADKVCVNAARALSASLISKLAARFGNQAVAVAVNYRNSTRISAVELVAVAVEMCGAGEILLTSIDREGMMEGCDLETIRAVSRAVDIPVIAHGGCGTYEHMAEAIKAGASAVAAGAMFQFTDQTPRGAAQYLAKRGFEVRT
jgi:cyclase